MKRITTHSATIATKIFYVLSLAILCIVLYACAEVKKEDRAVEAPTEVDLEELGLEEGHDISAFESSFDIEEASGMDFSQVYGNLSEIVVFEDLTEEDKCKTAFEIYKRTKCKVPKKKWAKQLVRKVGPGNLSVNDGTLSFPGWEVYKNEVNQLNGLIEMYYNRRAAFCQSMEFCKGADYTVLCSIALGKDVPDVVKERYKACTDLITKNADADLINSLTAIGNVLAQFKDGNVDANTVKSVLNTEIETLGKKTESDSE